MTGSADTVVVIGGGVIGASIAWHLAGRGVGEVLLIERDRVGSGTTWHSAGNITWKPSEDSDRPVAYMWELLQRLPRESGQDTGWHRTGRLFLARDAQAMHTLEGYHQKALADGVQGRLLEPADVPRHHPLASGAHLHGAWLNPASGRLDPAGLTAAYLRAAKAAGARVVEHCKVHGVVVEEGVTRGVLTDRGRIDAARVVVAAGLWSRDLLARSGLHLAHGACEHFYVIADVAPRLSRDTPSFICAQSLIYGREEVGGFLVGFFDRNAKPLAVSSLPEPFAFTLLGEDWEQIAPYWQAAAELFPALADAPIRRFINGPESYTPDGLPLLGAVPGAEGLYAACALNSAGVTYSGMAGHVIADLLTGASPRFDPTPFAPARFGERAADEAWLWAQMREAPSRFYLRHNR